MERVGLAAFRDRSSQQLSGGQQQRVAVARAIVHEPAVLLFDEPLSNLDAGLRDQTRAEIRQLQRDLNVSTIYVTHDQMEALSLSDRILVMREGQIRQMGTPETIYARPNDMFVAEVVGDGEFFRDQRRRTGDAHSMPAAGCFARRCAGQARAWARAMVGRTGCGLNRISAVRPGRILLRGTVMQRLFMGGYYEYVVDIGIGLAARAVAAREFAEKAPGGADF